MATSITPLSLATERQPKAGPQTASGPLWKVDLRPLGYSGFAQRGELWGIHFSVNPVSFSDDNSMIVTFLTREAVPTLSQRDESAHHLPLRLHGVFFDVAKGGVKAVNEWPTTEPRGGILAGRGGRFVIVTPDRMLLYSPGLELLKEFRLRTEDNPRFDLAGVHSSPSGGAILLQYNNYRKYWFQWMDPDTLQPLLSWEEVLSWITISDTKLVFLKETSTQPTGFVDDVLIRGLDGTLHTVCRSVDGKPDCGFPQFVSNELLALFSSGGLKLVQGDGKKVFVAKFKKDEELGRSLSASANGKRFAVQQFVNKGGSTLLDITSHPVFRRIVVFDVPSQQWIYNLEAKSQNINALPDFALSPDGSLLAILTDGIVRLYRLPETPNQPSAPQ